MNSKVAVWLSFRALRWLAWIVFFGWSVYFYSNRAPHLNSFGHLQHYAEAMFFIPAILAIFAGFLELMMREQAGIERPSLGQLIPPPRGQLPASS